MQAAGFSAADLSWTYELMDVPPAELGEAVGRLRDEGAGGANVTIPHKVPVLDHLDALDGTAEQAGSVNTIARRGGRLVGHNTDVIGIGTAMIGTTVTGMTTGTVTTAMIEVATATTWIAQRWTLRRRPARWSEPSRRATLTPRTKSRFSPPLGGVRC